MKIHFIAIGGSAMHNLAIALKRKGYEVSGSDDEIFEPSKSRLKKEGILPEQIGWNADLINESMDAIIVGMHARSNNPELMRAQELNIPCYSYPEYIFQQNKNKKRIVIGGSHGKTTITSMILHVLHFHNIDVDYMVGAQLEGFDCMVKLTEENTMAVLEGDEYLSSPTDLRPKFHLYQPNVALISGIAWDHINVFKTFEIYLKQFEVFIEKIESGGCCIYNADDQEVLNIVEKSSRTDIDFIPYHTPEYSVDTNCTTWEFDGESLEIALFGAHNLLNLMGAVEVLYKMGVTKAQIKEAIPSFTGASKRLETVGSNDQKHFYMYKDFAHAPSKLKATLNAVKEKHEDQKLIACMELHTFSSLNPNFFPQYKGCMDTADIGYVYFNPEVVAHKKLPPIDPEKLADIFDSKVVEIVTDSDTLKNKLMKHSFENAALLMMSSGNFDGFSFDQIFNEINLNF